MRVPRSFSRSLINTLSVLLIYTLTVSLCAPFALRRAEASPADMTAGGKAASPALTTADKKKGGRRDGELIVRYHEGVSEQDKTRLVEAKGAKRGKRLRGRSRLEKLTLRQGQDMDALIAELRRNPAVELVEPNYLISRDEVMPDDPHFPEQWSLHNTGATGGQPGADIQAVPAWETTTGATTTVIAVIDSGIDFTHPDLQNNQWTNNAEINDGNDNDNNGLTDDLHGWDWISDSGIVRDEQGHGTIVAGIIAAQGNNGIGTTGVMWRAGLMSLRVLDNTGTGDVADAVEAIDYAVDHGAQVINCSWGTDEQSIALKDAIQRAGTKGVVVVSSAGNSGRDIESVPYYPASYGLSNQIVVASTDNYDRLASWTNYGGTHVTIAAPGIDILTTRMGGGYMTVTGTSASTALATGIAGLIKTKRWWLSAAGTRAAIVDGSRQVAELTGKVSSGGVVSAAGALDALEEPEPEPTPTPTSGGGSDNPPTEGEPDSGTPGANMPDLDAARNIEPADPVAPSSIHADSCIDCDPGDPPPASGSDPYFATARSRPENETGQPGVDLGSRNFNWGIPLVSLPGRSGLDLNLGISYNSLAWTKQDGYIMFNAARGFPGPGFRLGLPTLEGQYVDQDSIDPANAYMLVLPSGKSVKLARSGMSGASILYESQDSSYIQAVDESGWGMNVTVRTTDGTQYTFAYPPGTNSLSCTKVKDRNGNYLTITYANNQVSTIVDTLSRTITFNYVNGYLDKITQTWNGQTHTWATFGYGSLSVNTNFPGLNYIGPVAPVTVLTQIGLADGTRYNFDYTSWGQVWKIRHYAADNHLLAYTSYNLPLNNTTPHTDCPRFTQRRDWAENWNNNAEAVTTYSVDPNSAGGGQPAWTQVTTPDGTIYKELFATTGLQYGLTTGTEEWVGSVRKKWTATTWTQADPALLYQKNPLVAETNVYDEAGNRRRTTFSYYPASSYGLVSDVYEYAANATTVLRRTHTDYNLTATYTSRRIIELPSMKIVYDGANKVFSKVEYQYDEAGIYFVNQGTITGHDTTNYGATFIAGRGNLTSVRRWDADYPTDATKVVESNMGYNNAGSVILTRDARAHQTSISYTDAYSDTTKNSLNTLAYPTKVTDPDGFYATTEYNYDMGAATKTSSPTSGTGTGITYADMTVTYDTAGRPTRVTNLENNAYTRWVYPTSNTLVQQYQTINSTVEAYSTQLLDGAGRVRGASTEHTFGTTPTYSGQYFIYDVMGRLWKQSNPIEMTGTWAPTGDDLSTGWKYTVQTYDWKGRPLVTTNTDLTIRTNTYGGCGCAGGEQVTAKDERGRQKRFSKDVLGRLVKVEELHYDGAVYSTTTYTYDTLDHLTQTNQAGQLRTFDYDGHGRLSSRTTPEQGLTTYTFNADDTVLKVTDARGASMTFAYNNRHLPTSITYGVPAGVAATPNVTLAYDAAGNRTSMTDGLGTATYHYDSMSRMDWEQRSFTGLTGTYKLSYAYNLAGELTNVTGPSQFGSVQVGYTYDETGRTTAVTGSGYGGVASYVNSLSYRAFGAAKQVAYGNTKTLSMTYDTRLRLTKWDVPGALGWTYAYSTPLIPEKTGRVAFANNLYDATLDRSYDYDAMGRLRESQTGNYANGHAGYTAMPTGTPTGPYAADYVYDQLGNMTWRNGWGVVNAQYSHAPQYVNNRIIVNPVTGAAMSYDASGNLTNDGQQTFTYDATGQQAWASGTNLSQNYDGDGLRIKKTENSLTTCYLRSSVLGKQVVLEISGSAPIGQMMRGYIYLGSQMLAIQEGGAVSWVHQDPVTKSQKLTDSTGAVVSWIDLDPWGGETARGTNLQQQPHRFTTYERDGNGGDEAMFRRYESQWQRFAQPDPYDGSYDLSDPQSFNRYAYTKNDPVNSVDPTGLMEVTYYIDGIPYDERTARAFLRLGSGRVTSHSSDWLTVFSQTYHFGENSLWAVHVVFFTNPQNSGQQDGRRPKVRRKDGPDTLEECLEGAEEHYRREVKRIGNEYSEEMAIGGLSSAAGAGASGLFGGSSGIGTRMNNTFLAAMPIVWLFAITRASAGLIGASHGRKEIINNCHKLFKR